MKATPLLATRFACCLASLPLLTCAAPGQEVAVPAGWDLSATLAFFRNLPLFDPAAFPETEGPVHCRFTEARNETKAFILYSNTYEFFRKTREGTFLHLSVEETSRTDHPANPDQTGLETVADSRQALAVAAEMAPGAAERPELSALVAYVLDHRVPLVSSEAGKLAKSLNYTREGKVRPGNYVQPRVAFVRQDEAIVKIRVYGLEALLTEDARAALQGGRAVENRVLEFSVNHAGTADVALVPLLPTPTDAP